MMDAQKLVLRTIESLNNAKLEADSCKRTVGRRSTIHKIHQTIKNYLLSLFGHSYWMNDSLVQIVLPDGRTIKIPTQVHDKKSYLSQMIRILVTDTWIALEDYFRGSNHSDPISRILSVRFSGNVPPSITILRHIRNSFHNNTMHTGRSCSITFKGKIYNFEQGKRLRTFHPIRILELIDDAVVQIAIE